MRAIVTGMIASYPVGGVAWDYGQYALGLEQLGFEVYYLEDTGTETYDPDRKCYGEDCSYGVGFLARALAELSPTLSRRWHFRGADDSAHGIGAAEMARLVAGADLFLNVSGGCLLRDEYMTCPRKVLIDTDPGWNHFVNYPRWDREPGWLGSHGFRAHDWFFSYATLAGRAGCLLPTLGIDWHPTRPPVVVDCWSPRPPGSKWTTVMTWNNFQRVIEHEGVTYGTKEREFGHIESVPADCPASFELAVGGTNPPVDRMRALGWSVVDSESVSRGLDDYRAYIESSRGEFSVAKNVYVATRSGWFSCRSVCYLAAGRPVVLEDTGFSEVTPTGEGLLAFSNRDEALRAIATVEADYPRHERAARGLARDHFDARLVLGEILTRIGM